MIGSKGMQDLGLSQHTEHDEQCIYDYHEYSNTTPCLKSSERKRQKCEKQKHQKEICAVGTHNSFTTLQTKFSL